jgi:hypothetical protein
LLLGNSTHPYNGSLHELRFFEKDYVANTINNTFSLMIHDDKLEAQLRTKKTHKLKPHENKAQNLELKRVPHAPEHETERTSLSLSLSLSRSLSLTHTHTHTHSLSLSLSLSLSIVYYRENCLKSLRSFEFAL